MQAIRATTAFAETQWRPHNRDKIAWSGFEVSGWGSFSGSLTSPKHPWTYAVRGWILGQWVDGRAKPKFQQRDGRAMSPGTLRHVLPLRWRWVAIATVFAPLSLVLVQCGKAPSAGLLAANTQAAAGDNFVDRFPTPQFNDRFPTA